MYCTECGHQLPDQARYCADCGTPVAGAPAKMTAKQPPEPASGVRPDQEEIPDKKERMDPKSPPRISGVTILFALIGLILILVLLNPWHVGQDRPKDFEGTRGNSQSLLFQGDDSGRFPI